MGYRQQPRAALGQNGFHAAGGMRPKAVCFTAEALGPPTTWRQPSTATGIDGSRKTARSTTARIGPASTGKGRTSQYLHCAVRCGARRPSGSKQHGKEPAGHVPDFNTAIRMAPRERATVRIPAGSMVVLSVTATFVTARSSRMKPSVGRCERAAGPVFLAAIGGIVSSACTYPLGSQAHRRLSYC